MLEPSFISRLRDPEIKNVFITGCGGGFDFVHGMLLYPALIELGKNVVIGSYSFGLPDKLPEDAPTFDSGSDLKVQIVNGSMTADEHYAPEINLCRYLDEAFENKKHEIYAYYARDFTVGKLTSLYTRICEHHEIDAVLAFDGGSDSLMAGDEAAMGDVVEDLTTVTAISDLDVKLKMMFVIGMGADRYNDVSDASALRAVAELSASGGFLGSISIEKDSEAHRFYSEAVMSIFSRQTFHSTIASFVLSTITGYYGNQKSEYLPFPEGEERHYYLWPLMSVLWAFNIESVAERSLIPEAIRSCENVPKAWKAITRMRQSIIHRIRPVEDFPSHEEMRRAEQYDFTTGSLSGGLFDEVEELGSP